MSISKTCVSRYQYQSHLQAIIQRALVDETIIISSHSGGDANRLLSSSNLRRQITVNRGQLPSHRAGTSTRYPFSTQYQLFSTAVANDYSSKHEKRVVFTPPLSPPPPPPPPPASNGDRLKEYRMPRLHALRERLLIEKHHQANHRHSGRTLPESIIRNPENQSMLVHPNVENTQILTDTHGRHHNYLRISLTERCNLRCQYCMPPEGVPLSHSSALLTDDEIIRLVRLFVKNGVNKIRFTGGEPLLRPNLVSIVRSISDIMLLHNHHQTSFDENNTSDHQTTNNINNNKNSSNRSRSNTGLIGITTNGISLTRHKMDALVEAGLTGVNISLDTLRADRFMDITRRNGLDKVMRAIENSVHAFQSRYGTVRHEMSDDGGGGGSSRVKINCVVMRGVNDDEIFDFVRLGNNYFDGEVDIRFIEWMPFNDNSWSTSKFLSYQDMMTSIIQNEGTSLERVGDGPNDTTKWWRAVQTTNIHGGNKRSVSRIGFITSMSEHFCSSCNRLRITADGKIKVCLFGSNEKEVSLRDIMRKHHTNNDSAEEKELAAVIYTAVQKKTFALGGHGSAENIARAADNRPMTLIGG